MNPNCEVLNITCGLLEYLLQVRSLLVCLRKDENNLQSAVLEDEQLASISAPSNIQKTSRGALLPQAKRRQIHARCIQIYVKLYKKELAVMDCC